MLGVFITLLLIVHVVVCLLMTVLVLMQRPRKDGLGAAFGGGMTDTMFGAQTTNVLQKATVFLGGLFFVITLTLALLLANKQRALSARDASILGVDDITAETQGATETESGTDAPVDVNPQFPPPVEEAPADAEPVTDESVEPAEPATTDAEQQG